MWRTEMKNRTNRRPGFCIRLGLLLLASLIGPMLVGLATPAHAETLVGAMAGDFDVSSSGAAIYSIPIAVAPGTAGMEPDLSITYSNQIEGGMLGVGFILTGHSIISHCKEKPHLDGQQGGESDFCLNGRVLYENPLTRVTPNGVVGDTPASFTVEHPDGTIESYGTSNDSQIEVADGSRVRAWALTERRDRHGNYIRYTYLENPEEGEFVPLTIEYTGNQNLGLNPDARVVFEYEEGTQRTRRYWKGSPVSSLLRLKTLYTYGPTSEQSALVRQYHFEYQASPATGRSLLRSIAECTSDDDCLPATEFTYSADAFGQTPDYPYAIDWSYALWDGGLPMQTIGLYISPTGKVDKVSRGYYLTQEPAYPGGPAQLSDQPLIRFNGFGRYDEVYGPDGNIPGLHPEDDPYQVHRLFFDNDADKECWQNTEVPFLAPEGLQLRIMLDHGTGSRGLFIDVMTSDSDRVVSRLRGELVHNNEAPPQYGIGDFNGDSCPDLMIEHETDAGRKFKIVDSSILFEDDLVFKNVQLNRPLDLADQWFVGDLNGGSVDDLIIIDESGGVHTFAAGQVYASIETLESSLDGIFSVWGSSQPAWESASNAGDWKFAYVNADPYLDILHFRGEVIETALSRGDGSFEVVRQETELYVPWGEMGSCMSVGDINRDGLQDLVFSYCKSFLNEYTHSTSWLNFLLSKGDGTYAIDKKEVPPATGQYYARYWFQSGPNWPGYGFSFGEPPAFNRLVDTNKDGRLELIMVWAARDWLINGMTEQISFRKQYDVKRTYYLEDASIPTTDVLTEIHHGLGRLIRIDYEAVSAGRQPQHIVSSVEHDDGVDGQYHIDYDYSSSLWDRETGRLSFRQITSLDSRNDTTHEVIYTSEPGYFGERIQYITHRLADGTKYKGTSQEWPTSTLCGRYSRRPEYLGTIDENGTIVETVQSWDDWCHPTSVLRTSDNHEGVVYVEQVDTEYRNDQDRWLIGQVERVVTTLIRQGECTESIAGTASLPDVVREELFFYNEETGQIIERQSISHAVDATRIPAAATRITRFEHDASGNLIAQIELDENLAEGRVTQNIYGGYGTNQHPRFVSQRINAEDHVSRIQYDARWGLPTIKTDANGQQTVYQYDTLGRLEAEYHPDGTATRVSRGWCETASACPNDAMIYVVTTTDGAPRVTEYMDALGQVVRKSVEGFSGDIHTDIDYDNLGRAFTQSSPYLTGRQPLYHTYTYDALGRIKTHQRPDESRWTYSYDFGSREITDPNGNVRVEHYDAEGRVIRVQQGNGRSVTDYSYGADGNLWLIQDATGQPTYMFYNSFGEKVIHWDADRGLTQTTYDRYGQLVLEAHEGHVTQFEYDRLGRVVKRHSAEGTATWTYDEAANGIGLIAQSRSADGLSQEIFLYDEYSRIDSVSRTVNGTDWYTSAISYNGLGQVEKTVYPGGRFHVDYAYTESGFLRDVHGYADGNTTPVVNWTLTEADALGQTVAENYGGAISNTFEMYPETHRLKLAESRNASGELIRGSQLTYDSLGQVTSRYRFAGSIGGEYFQYDSLNRLDYWESPTGDPVDLEYDAGGNIASRSDVGQYQYGTRTLPNGTAGGPGPHSVISTTGSHTATYAYDARGNRVAGGGTEVAYSSYAAKPVRIQSGATLTQYGYDAAHMRVRSQVTHGGSVLKRIQHLGEHFEIVEEQGQTIWKHRVHANGQLIGQASLTLPSQGPDQWKTHYFLTDPLGSTSVVTNELGEVLERIEYDPFGQIISPGGHSAVTDLAFTGQRIEAEHGLYDYGGRTYDPRLGRFLQADPLIPDAFDSQSLNPYSYVRNNPLNRIDPSGYFGVDDLNGKGNPPPAPGWYYDRGEIWYIAPNPSAPRPANGVLHCGFGWATDASNDIGLHYDVNPDGGNWLKRSIRFLGRLITEAITTIAVDAFAFTYGMTVGKIWTFALDVGAIGQALQSFGNSPFMTGLKRLGSALGNFLYNTPFPFYGFYNGAGYGTRQFVPNGTEPSRAPLNKLDWAGFSHDESKGDHREWLKNVWSPNTPGRPVGPLGLAYQSMGTPLFAVAGAFQGPSK